jgi:putative sugar O-methyltransferase
MMHELKVETRVAQRLRAFMESKLFSGRFSVAKSSYWEYHAGQLHAEIGGGSVGVSGSGYSGYYVPASASPLRRLMRRARLGIRQPSKITRWLFEQVKSRVGTPRLLSYEKAFDAVMGEAEISVPIRSPFLIDHSKLVRCAKVFADFASLKKHYQAWSGYEASSNIIIHYYYQNILRGFVAGDRVRTVLEIGGGNGNFASILFADWAPVRVILIDLPETLAVSIPYLSNLFPEARLILPHEIPAGGLPDDFDLAFLTADQAGLLADDSVDLAINCHSFQEMRHEQITVYFKLVQRVCRESGCFFTANRVEKIPCGPDSLVVEQPDPPNRFADYPWEPGNEVLVYELSRLSRLIQLDPVAIRLERVH